MLSIKPCGDLRKEIVGNSCQDVVDLRLGVHNLLETELNLRPSEQI